MKKHIITILLLAIFSQTVFAQMAELDSIFTSDGIVLANVKKIAPDVIEYSFPNEEAITAIYKNTVKKIRFSSGREQVFTENIFLSTVNNAFDYGNVATTRLESETKGLMKVDEVSVKATARTAFSNSTSIEEIAFHKLKVTTAMLGGNLIYVLDKSILSNQFGNQYLANSLESGLAGLVYTDRLPKMEDFKALIKDKKSFVISKAVCMGRNSNDIEEGRVSEKNLVIENLYEENRFIYINAKGFESVLLRVVSFDENQIVVVWKNSDRNRIYNLFLKP